MSANPHGQAVGQLLQLAGVVAFAVGVVLSLQHYAIGALFVGGAAAFFIGRKLRAQ